MNDQTKATKIHNHPIAYATCPICKATIRSTASVCRKCQSDH